MLKQWIVCVCVVTQDLLFVTPWPGANQASLSLALSRQEYWSRLLVPTPGDLPDPGIEPSSLALAGRFLPVHHLGNLPEMFNLNLIMRTILQVNRPRMSVLGKEKVKSRGACC